MRNQSKVAIELPGSRGIIVIRCVWRQWLLIEFRLLLSFKLPKSWAYRCVLSCLAESLAGKCLLKIKVQGLGTGGHSVVLQLPTLRRWRREEWEFKVMLGYRISRIT